MKLDYFDEFFCHLNATFMGQLIVTNFIDNLIKAGHFFADVHCKCSQQCEQFDKQRNCTNYHQDDAVKPQALHTKCSQISRWIFPAPWNSKLEITFYRIYPFGRKNAKYLRGWQDQMEWILLQIPNEKFVQRKHGTGKCEKFDKQKHGIP